MTKESKAIEFEENHDDIAKGCLLYEVSKRKSKRHKDDCESEKKTKKKNKKKQKQKQKQKMQL